MFRVQVSGCYAPISQSSMGIAMDPAIHRTTAPTAPITRDPFALTPCSSNSNGGSSRLIRPVAPSPTGTATTIAKKTTRIMSVKSSDLKLIGATTATKKVEATTVPTTLSLSNRQYQGLHAKRFALSFSTPNITQSLSGAESCTVAPYAVSSTTSNPYSAPE